MSLGMTNGWWFLMNKPITRKRGGPRVYQMEGVNRNEMESMYDNHARDLVGLTPGYKTVGCKLVFKRED